MRSTHSKIITASLVLLVTIELVALIEQILFPYYETGTNRGFIEVASTIFWTLAPFSPGLFILLLYANPMRYIFACAGRYMSGLARFMSWMSRSLAHLTVRVSFQPKLQGRSSRWQSGLLVASFVAAAGVAYMPYRSDLNSQGALVGVDSYSYSVWLSEMLRRQLGDAIGYAFVSADGGARPIPLLILYVFARSSAASPDVVIRLVPAILAPLLAGASYLFIRSGLGDKWAACLAANLSACSCQLSVGVWAGYYASWLALSESYVLLTCFLLFLRHRSQKTYLLMFPGTMVLVFTHPWTWTIVLVLIAIVSTDGFIRNRDGALLRPILLLVGFNLAVDLGRTLMVGSYGGARAAYDVAARASPFEVVQFWPNSVAAFTQYYDATLANATYLALAFLAIVSLYRGKDEFSRILVLWTALLAVPFILFDSLLQSRLVYVTPIPILAVIGVLTVARNLAGRLQVLLLLLVVVLVGANSTIQTMIQLVSILG